MDVRSLVEEFRVTMGQIKDPNLSTSLIFEEYDEWYNAEPLGEAGELKELADLVYVIYGYANSMGWDLDEAIRRVHKNNMERCVWPDGSIHKNDMGKVLKNPEAPKVSLEDLV